MSTETWAKLGKLWIALIAIGIVITVYRNSSTTKP